MGDVAHDGDRPASRSVIWTATPFVAALVIGAWSIGLIVELRGSGRGYSSQSTGAALMTLLAGLGLIVSGAIHRLTHRREVLGLLAAGIGVTWLAADWIAWSAGPAWIRSVAMLVAPFYVPLVVHLILAIGSGRRVGVARVFVAMAYGGTAIISAVIGAVRDPFFDRHCWRNCTDNSFLVHSAPDTASALVTLALYATVIAIVLASCVAVVQTAMASTHRWRRLLTVLAPAVVLGLTLATYAAAIAAEPAERAGRGVFNAIFYARAGGMILCAAAITLIVLREVRVRTSIARLAIELGEAPPPGSLKMALSRSLGDDQLDVAYFSLERNVYLDQNGQVVDPQPRPTQTLTPIVRNGERVAVVVHDRALAASHDLAGAIGSASRLAVDNERLRAQALAQLSDLQASRARIVETADNTRRRLERDLHDGAQQRLLALLYELRLARDDAMAAGDLRMAEQFTIDCELALQALQQLRDLAQGIYPAILSEAGLGAALATFADSAPMRVDMVGVPDGRFVRQAETVAYLAVTGLIDRAAQRNAKHLVATFSVGSGTLSIDVVDDGGGDTDADDLIHVRDRVGALGGRVDFDGSHVTTVIPCE